MVHQNGVLAIRQRATKRSSTDCVTFCIFLAKTSDCRSEMKWSKLVYTTRNHNSTERLVGGFSLYPLPIVKRGWFLMQKAKKIKILWCCLCHNVLCPMCDKVLCPDYYFYLKLSSQKFVSIRLSPTTPTQGGSFLNAPVLIYSLK